MSITPVPAAVPSVNHTSLPSRPSLPYQNSLLPATQL
jgi:hypothetical protein